MATTFKFEHVFPDIPLEKFLAHLNDPKLNKMLEQGLSFDERKLMEKNEDPEGIEWIFRVKKIGGLPKAITKIINGDAFCWLEKSHYVRKDRCIYWQILPASSMLNFKGKGKWILKEYNGGCKREIVGEISVKIPFLGKMVEGFLLEELNNTYKIEPKIQERFYNMVD